MPQSLPAAVELPRAAERRKVFLQAGQVVACAEPTEVTTILGSCVAVCMWDERLRVGGANHYLLPFAASDAVASPRFGNFAMEVLATRLEALGARRCALRAAVFGGSCMFQHLRSAEHLGAKNAALAVAVLRRWGVEVVRVDVGGERGRKLRFRTDEGSPCSISI